MPVNLEMFALQLFARPPRVLLVTPGGEDWAGWAGRGLLALSELWGGCASVALPAQAAQDPALDRLLTAYQPDHVLTFVPTYLDADAVGPGTSEQVLRSGGIEPSDDTIASMRLEEYYGAGVAEAEEIARDLRRRLGALAQSVDDPHHVHLRGLAAGRPDDEMGLTARRAVYGDATWGVPAARLGSAAALAAAMRLGVQPDDQFAEVPDERWAGALTEVWDRGMGLARLKRELPSEATAPVDGAAVAPLDGVPVLDPRAAACTRVSRGRLGAPFVVVLGDAAADFALAGLCRQVLDGVWAPTGPAADAVLAGLSAGLQRLRGGCTFTSASLSPEEITERVRTAPSYLGTPAVTIRTAAETVAGRPTRDGVVVTGPRELDLSGHSLVTVQGGTDERSSVLVEVGTEGRTEASIGMPPWVPQGLDAARHSWLVTVMTPSRSVPPHPTLTAAQLLRRDANEHETFVKASDGGVTYWSHRWDFVPSGALLAGRLAGPPLAWPTAGEVLATAAAPLELRVSEAGRRALVAQRLLGSRESVEQLAGSPGWSLARAFLAPQDFGIGSHGYVALQQRRSHVLSWTGIQDATIQDWEAAARAELRDAWSERGVLRRGLVLGCEECPAVDFYPLGDVAQVYVCRSCGGSNTLRERRWTTAVGELQEPNWYFQLHPAVSDLVANNGDVPLLASALLRDKGWGAVGVHPEFRLFDDKKEVAEVDFGVITADGVWIGEGKKNSRLGPGGARTKTAFNKLLLAAERLDASGIVLATSEPAWKDATLAAAADELGGRGAAGKRCPVVLQATGLGTAQARLRSLDGRAVSRI